MSTEEKPGVGALIQTNLIGPQERIMYDNNARNPFTDSTWVRTTPGAIEQNEISFPCVFGTLNKKVIPKRGDMLGNLALSINLPVVAGAGINDYWVEKIGYIILKKLRLTLNDAELDTSERLWLSIHDDLFLPDAKRDGVLDMIGRSGMRLTQEHRIIVPLKFFNCYNDGQPQNFLPLLSSTSDNTLILEIETESFSNCVTSYSGLSAPTELECELITDYVFLDAPEKERLVNNPYPMIAEIVQDVEGVSYREIMDPVLGHTRIKTDKVLIDMTEINYPVKYLAFVAYETSAVSSNSYFTYLDIIDKVSILFDGEERTRDEDKDHFSLIQTYHHATRCIQDRVYMYSFALDAHTVQPNGHFTFSNIRKASIRVTLKEPRDNVLIKVFVVGYRWIDFEGGSARVRFI